MKGNGKGGDSSPKKSRRKSQRRRGKEKAPAAPQGRVQAGETSRNKNKRAVNFALAGEGKFVRKRVSPTPRPKWTPPEAPELSLTPLPCAWCEKPIREFSSAFTDPETGKPVHFDCAISRIAERERLDEGDSVAYIGGGRFGVMRFGKVNGAESDSPRAGRSSSRKQGASQDAAQGAKKFVIKKILEWESTETRSEWRVALCDHFSVT